MGDTDSFGEDLTLMNNQMEYLVERDLKQIRDKLNGLVEPKNVGISNFDINFVLFGLAGCGKSSFIWTLKRALAGREVGRKETHEALVVQDIYSNEGTTRLTKVALV